MARPKLFAINYTIYFQAHDAPIAVGVGVGFAPTIIEAIRNEAFAGDSVTLAIPQTGSMREVKPEEYFLGVGSYRRSLRVPEIAHAEFDRRFT